MRLAAGARAGGSRRDAVAAACGVRGFKDIAGWSARRAASLSRLLIGSSRNSANTFVIPR